MTINELIREIHNTPMTNDEWNRVRDAIKLKYNRISRIAIRELEVGDQVTFNAGPRRGGWLAGKVMKINLKNVKVFVPRTGQTWNVNASMLKLIEETSTAAN